MSTILVADNDGAMRQVVARAVKALGHQALLARDCAELRERGLGEALGAVVADVELGDGDGVDACLLLRQRRPGLRIVLMTGGMTEAERARASGLGPVLLKPFTLEELDRALREALA